MARKVLLTEFMKLMEVTRKLLGYEKHLFQFQVFAVKFVHWNVFLLRSTLDLKLYTVYCLNHCNHAYEQ